MPTLVEEAIAYAKLGWWVLPGESKKPYVKWAEAAIDPIAVTKLFEKFSHAEILVLCGPSKLGVIDVDTQKGQPDWSKVPASSWEATTPSGGVHLIFSDPDGTVPTTAGRIDPVIDTRGVGGLIVVPSVNSPKRRWVRREGTPAPFPRHLYPNLGSPMARVVEHTDDIATWKPALAGERMPNEDCPGSYHVDGRQPRLGVQRMSNGTVRVGCWSGCTNEEIIPLLIEAGRYTAEELGGGGEGPRISSFITRDALMAIQPPTWMIDPYIQENALVMLGAKFNTGKTFVAVNWALDLASQGRRVLYVALEGLTGLQGRVRAWEEHHEQTIRNGILFSPRGYSLNLLSDRMVEGFTADVQAEGGFDLVVIDNLGEAMPGDENDSSTVAQAMYALNQIRSAAGGAVLDLHNSGHGGQVRARGHSKMLDVHDTVIYLEAIEGSINGLKVISGKERNAERFVSRRAQLKPVADSLVAVMGGKAVAESNPTYNAIKLGHDTSNKIAAHLGVPYTTAVRHVKELLEAGDIAEMPVQGREKRYETLWDKTI